MEISYFIAEVIFSDSTTNAIQNECVKLFFCFESLPLRIFVVVVFFSSSTLSHLSALIEVRHGQLHRCAILAWWPNVYTRPMSPEMFCLCTMLLIIIRPCCSFMQIINFHAEIRPLSWLFPLTREYVSLIQWTILFDSNRVVKRYLCVMMKF